MNTTSFWARPEARRISVNEASVSAAVVSAGREVGLLGTVYGHELVVVAAAVAAGGSGT